MKTIRRYWRALAALSSAGLIIAIVTLNSFADVPQPVLRIEALGSNNFLVAVTNSVTNGVYVLYWVPVLNDANFSWQPVSTNSGETSWTVDGQQWPSSWFRVRLGVDQDGDSVVDWQDADPNDPSIGILTIVIDSPLNGSTIN